jgi:hypothetical protein
MRKFLITAGTVLVFTIPALAQSVTTETQTKQTTIESVPAAPLAVQPVPVPVPDRTLPGISSESRTITNSGDSGMSRTDKRSETYLGTDGMVHENKSITHEEQR